MFIVPIIESYIRHKGLMPNFYRTKFLTIVAVSKKIWKKFQIVENVIIILKYIQEIIINEKSSISWNKRNKM